VWQRFLVYFESDYDEAVRRRVADDLGARVRLLLQCNVCGSDKVRPYAFSFGKGFVHYSMAECQECRIYFANPMRTEDELDEHYASHFYSASGQRLIQEFPRRVEDGIAQLQREVVPFRPPPGKFLEVGAGYGPTLMAARRLGYDAEGIEPSDDARAWASQEHGIAMRAESLERCSFADGSIDVIYAWHVIEHVPDMSRFLKEVHRILKPEGVFFFGTENYRSVPQLFTRAHHLLTGACPGIDTADEHTYLFTPSSIRSIFPRFGFRIENVYAYQPHEKRHKYFAPARRGSLVKRAVHHVVLGAVYGMAMLVPNGGAHLKAVVRRV